MTRPTPAEILSRASAATQRLNAGLLGASAVSAAGQAPKPVESPAKGIVRDAKYGGTGLCEHLTVAAACPVCRDKAPHGRCPHTGRAYRSKTEARWASEHPEHLFEPFPVGTVCGVYWPDFVEVVIGWQDHVPLLRLYEVKGGWIRDRAMHKVKAAIAPARRWLNATGIWLAQWKGGKWTVSEVREG